MTVLLYCWRHRKNRIATVYIQISLSKSLFGLKTRGRDNYLTFISAAIKCIHEAAQSIQII